MGGDRNAGLSRRDCLALGAAALLPTVPRRAAPLALHRGISLWPWFSLTREFPAPRTDYAWPPFQLQRPVPQAADLHMLRAAGFDFVRLPVDPGPFLAGAADNRERLLSMLDGALTLCDLAGLAVIVNLQGNAATHYWTPARLYGDGAERFAAFRDLAVALAARLAGRRGRYALEPVNEPPQGCGAASWARLQQELLSALRQAAPRLTLVATGACGSMVAGLTALDPAPVETLAPVIYTFHFYEPYLFTHQGAPWMTGEKMYWNLNRVPWPGSAGSLAATMAATRARLAADRRISAAEKQAVAAYTEEQLRIYFNANPGQPFIRSYLSQVAAWADRNRIPRGRVLMGEFGALRTDARYTAAPAADRARYIADVRSIAESYGFPWAFWNLYDGMGLIDDRTHKPDPAIIAALGLRPARAASGPETKRAG